MEQLQGVVHLVGEHLEDTFPVEVPPVDMPPEDVCPLVEVPQVVVPQAGEPLEDVSQEDLPRREVAEGLHPVEDNQWWCNKSHRKQLDSQSTRKKHQELPLLPDSLQMQATTQLDQLRPR